MIESAIHRSLRRRLAQIVRRLEAPVAPAAALVADEIERLSQEIADAALCDADDAITIGIMALERLPSRLIRLDDKERLASRALEAIPPLLVGITDEEKDAPDSAVSPRDVFGMLFCLWVGDETGFLTHVDETLLDAARTLGYDDLLIEIAREHIRHLPLVFPALPGRKLDLARTILRADRHRVERLLGEILALRGQNEYSILVARGHARATGDVADLMRFLDRAGQLEEALEVGRRALHRPDTPRRPLVQAIHEELIERREGSGRTAAALEEAFVAEPDFARFAALKSAVPARDWPIRAARVLGRLQKEGREPALVFRLYLGEGLMTDADGVVVTQPIDAMVLAEAAQAHLESHPQMASGWLVTAAHRILEGSRREHYETAALWLQTVRRVADLCDQRESFARAIESFRSTYRRRPALLRILERVGL